ncbi:MAG: LysM peptidoglycan-binding domain-containing protein [Lachnospiraceae bacterium]|nr:LysM peptidoglycan-binding domain-containing protein [Lachnospiraceae bacterium]
MSRKGMESMIEIVYDKEELTEDNIFAGITLPKNIRQIGVPSGNRRIYIEDYVMTYLNQLANPNSTFARGAILVGETVKGENGEIVFVSGALAAQNLELNLEETTFDGETWSYIYQEVKNYFPDLEVVGWFLSRMGFSTTVNDMIVQLHMDNFAGMDKVLYIMDALEGEDAFYMMEGDGLRRQSGYYIYYARNEAMQNFMIATKEDAEPKQEDEVEQKDEAVLRNYRKIMEERAKNAKIERMNRRLYAVCSGLIVAVLALGIAVFSNYQMLEKMEYKLVENGIIALENSIDLTEKKTENEDSTEKKDLTKGQNGTEKKKAEIDVNKVRTAAANLPQYYTVQNGDTLSSISFKMYNSVGYVAELMEANELGEADEIHEGDKILIPSIQ